MGKDKKYAIFDMDGTLVDSMKYWKILGREYLVSKGFTKDLEEVFELIKPMTMSESADFFAEKFFRDKTGKEIMDELNAMIEHHYCQDIPLKDGVKAYLEKLRKEGMVMCVTSVTDEALMKSCLTRLGVAQYFEFLLSCETIGVGKRRPDVYFEAIRRLGAQKEETVIYEDAFYAAETAKKAGFYVVGVYEKCNRENDRVKEIADEYIMSFTEV